MTFAALLLAAAVTQAPQPQPDAAAPAKAPPKATFFGFMHVQSETAYPQDGAADEDPVTTGSLRRARIGARGQVTDQVGYSLTVELGPNSQGLKDAYASLKLLPGIELRLGQQKTPFGYEIFESDTKLLWVNNAYAISKLARGPTSRDIGVGALGKWSVAGPVAVELAAAGVNGAGENKSDDLDEKNVWARAGVVVKVPDAATVKLGGSYGYGRQASLGADGKLGVVADVLDDTYFYFSTIGADVQVDAKYVFAVAEWVTSAQDATVYTAPAALSRRSTDLAGWYVAAVGRTPWNVGPVVRYDVYDRNTAASAKDDVQKRLTLGAYHDVAALNARFIVNYELDASDEPVRKPDLLTLFAQVMF